MATATREADEPRPFFDMLARIIPPAFARLLQHWRARRLSHARDKRSDSRSDPIVVGARLVVASVLIRKLGRFELDR